MDLSQFALWMELADSVGYWNEFGIEEYVVMFIFERGVNIEEKFEYDSNYF